MKAVRCLKINYMLLMSLILLLCITDIKGAEQSAHEAAKLMVRVEEIRSQIKAQETIKAELHFDLAVTLQQLNHLKPDGGRRIPEAEAAYRICLEAFPKEDARRVHVLGNFAALLLEAGRAEESLVLVDQALSMVRSGGLLFNRAKALSTMGQMEAAELAYKEAAAASFGEDIESFTKAIAAVENLGDEQLVQTDEVISHLKTILEPPYTSKHQNKGRNRKNVAAWLINASSMELSWLAFGAYKARERRKQYQEAWTALTMANNHMKKYHKYDVEVDRRHLEIITSVFQGKFDVSGSLDETPVFVVGLPRSGSTLVEQILAAHSRAWGAGEDTDLAPLTPEVNQVLNTPGKDVYKELNRIGKKYVDNMRNRLPPRSSANEPPVEKIIDKMLRNLWLVGYIDLILPKSKIIHVMRHPLDAGFSCYAQPFGYNGMPWAWDLENIAAQIKMTHTLAQHWEKAMPERIMTVYYEELVEFPKQVASEILSWVGLQWEDAVMDFHKINRTVATASMAQVRKPMYRTSVNKWQHYHGHLLPFKKALGNIVEDYEANLASVLSRRHRAHDLEKEL